MSKVKYSIEVDDAKLFALEKMMELKKTSLQSELLDTFDHLYDRHVPQSVRYVTESLDQLNSRSKIKKPRKKGFEEDSGSDTL